MFVDGAFRDAADGGRFVTENPATGQPITEVAQGGPVDVDIAVAAARRAADDGRWSRLDPGVRKRILIDWANLIEAQCPRARPDRDHRRGQAHHRHGRAGHAGDRRLHPLARRGGRQAVRPGRALAGGHGRHDHPRAVRRRRGGHPLELSRADGGLEARPCPRDRQHRGPQARLDDVAQPPADRRAREPGGPPGRGRQRRDRAGRHGRRGDRPTPRRRHASPSPVRPRWAGASSTTPPTRTSSGSSSSSAARARRSCSAMCPTSTPWRRTSRSRSSGTWARTAARARG